MPGAGPHDEKRILDTVLFLTWHEAYHIGAIGAIRREQGRKAIAELGRLGIFPEPAGATAYAGLVKAAAANIVRSGDPVLVLNTGSGLKDVRAAIRAVPEAPIIQPTLDAVKKIL